MKNSVTIQDIANALGLSRNTVSKALNGQPVPDKTRSIVLNAAIEMGYKSYRLAAAPQKANEHRQIAIVSNRLLIKINYYIYVLRGIEESIADQDIELVQFQVASASSFERFKRYLSANHVDGIICIEFFQQDYAAELMKLGYPMVLLDTPFTLSAPRGKYDIILPESQHVIRSFCLRMIQKEHCQTFGFVGDYQHCRSFYERFEGMREALFLSGIPYNPQYSILYDDASHYDTDVFVGILRDMPELPDCLIAANDSIATYLLEALKLLDIKVPDTVRVIGFDNLVESKRTDPPLTSVNVSKTFLGQATIKLMLDRLAEPSRPSQTVYVSTSVVSRATTSSLKESEG